MLGASVHCVCAYISPLVPSFLEFSCCSITSVHKHSLQHIHMHTTTYPMQHRFPIVLPFPLPHVPTSLQTFFYVIEGLVLSSVHSSVSPRPLGFSFSLDRSTRIQKEGCKHFYVTIFIPSKLFISHLSDSQRGSKYTLLDILFLSSLACADIHRTQV